MRIRDVAGPCGSGDPTGRRSCASNAKFGRRPTPRWAVRSVAMGSPTLLVLAGGMSRRFGALKQVAPVGPDGAALIDHTIADAATAGLGGVVLVVRPSVRTEVVDHVVARSPLPVTVVEQPEPEPGRSRPWGAADAVARGLACCPTPAASVNADDYYGPEAMQALADWLRHRAAADRAALVTWPLAATTSRRGPVTRALCRVGGGRLRGLDEVEGIEIRADGALASPAGELDAVAPVSMNMWGLHPVLAGPLADAVAAFQLDHLGPDDELPLPTAIDGEVRAGRLAVEVLPAGARWVGITHAADLDDARLAMRSRADHPTDPTQEATTP